MTLYGVLFYKDKERKKADPQKTVVIANLRERESEGDSEGESEGESERESQKYF